MIFRQTRHIILLVLLAGMALFLTKEFWFFPSEKAVRVSFTSQAAQPIDYQVFYTASPDRSFNPEEKVTQNIKAGKQQVNILIPSAKVLRFRLDLGQFPQEVTLSDLKVIGDKTVAMDNLSDFILHQIDSSKQDGKFFRLTSNQQDPYLIYKSPLNLSAKRQVRIDYYIFFIIFVISMLAAHKIVQYLAQFKFKEKTSRIDIVFVTVFFVLLFIPMMKISDAEKSDQENRMLAKYVPFIKDGQINLKYSTNFESWYNDHFLGRDFLINIYNFLEKKINPNRGNKNGLIGKDDWLFSTFYNAVSMYRHANLFTEEELQTIGKNLTEFVAEAKKRGVKEVYFYLSNDKESLYGEYYPDWIVQLDQPSRLEQLYAFIKQNYPRLKVFNFANQLRNIKNQGEVLFFKAGTHMNPLGVFYEYHFLMQEIQKDFPDLHPISLQDFKITEEYFDDKDIYRALNLSEKTYNKENFKNKKLNFTRPINATAKTTLSNTYYVRMTLHNSKLNNTYRLISLNDSFLLRYRYLLGETFSSVIVNFWGYGKPFEIPSQVYSDWGQNRNDIVLVETTERFLDRFLTLKYPCSGK